MRWLLLVLLLGLTLPAAAMFDYFDQSPNEQYHVTRRGDQLLLEHNQKVLWSRPLGFESVQVSDQGQVCLHQAERQIFLDRQGQELLSAPNSEGWFAADGSRYFGRTWNNPELQQLKLVPGASYQPVDAATLKSQAPTQEVLCELAARGLDLPPDRLPAKYASAWRNRRSPDPKAPLEACLFSPPDVFWQHVRYADTWEVHVNLGKYLQRRGRPALEAGSRQFHNLDAAHLEAVLHSLENIGPLRLGPLRKPLEEIANRSQYPAPLAISVLARGEGLPFALKYLSNPSGRPVLLLKLAQRRESTAIPLLLQLLEKDPKSDAVLQALRFQCRVALPADPVLWRKWCSTSQHSLEERLAGQSRRQLRGFLLASWSGHLTRQDFANVPRLVEISPVRFDSKAFAPEPQPLGPWGSSRQLANKKGFLAMSAPTRFYLLDTRGQRLTPDRHVSMPGALSAGGTYVQEIGEHPRLVHMPSGRILDLPGDGPRGLTFSPDETEVAVAGPESLRFYELPSTRLRTEVPLGRMLSMEWKGLDLTLSDGGWNYRYRLDALPTPAALAPSRQQLLAELWSGQRLQGGVPVRLNQSQWQDRLQRWQAEFGPGWAL